jgi:hypothetical protein
MNSLKRLPASYFVDGDKLPSTFHAKQVEAIEYLFLRRRTMSMSKIWKELSETSSNRSNDALTIR